MPNFSGLVQVGKTFIQANRPELLLGAAITATIGSVVLAAKGGYEARGIVEAEERDREYSQDPRPLPLTTREKAELTWKCYMPAAITTVGALGSTTGLHFVHIKEKKALVAAGLAAVEEVKAEAKRFSDEIDNALTPAEKKDIQDRIFERNVNPATGVAVMQNTDGEVEEFYLIRDGKTGRDIWSNKIRVEDAVNELNNVLNGSGDAELNHFYTLAGFGSIPEGDRIGWSGALVSLEWSTTVRDDGRPVRQFDFRPAPKKGYDSPHG